MSDKIPILLDPSLEVKTAELKAAWSADPEAKEFGQLQIRTSPQQFGAFVELVVIPYFVGVSAGVTIEVAKPLLKEAAKKTAEVINRLLASKVKEPMTVQQQSLDNGQEGVVVQKK